MRPFLLLFLSLLTVLTAGASETGSEFGFSPQDGRGGAPSSSSGSYSSSTSKVGFGWIVYWPKGSSPTDGRPSVSYSVGTSSGYSGSPTLTGDGLRYYQLHGVTTVSYSSGVTVTMSLDGTAVCTATCTGHGSTTSDWSLVGNYPAWSGGTAPSIDSATMATSATVGGAANYSVSASGTAPLSYQWKVNGTAVTGATAATWSINPVAKTDDGKVVTCVVTNAVGSATAGPATLVVYWGPDISAQPQAQTVTEGNALNLSVTASGKNGHALSYQWKKDGVSITGATGATYTVSAAGSVNAGSYTVVVTDTVDVLSTTSSAATVTVQAAGGGQAGAAQSVMKSWTVKVIMHAGFSSETVRWIGRRARKLAGGSYDYAVVLDTGDIRGDVDSTTVKVSSEAWPEHVFYCDIASITTAPIEPDVSFSLPFGRGGAYPTLQQTLNLDAVDMKVRTVNDGAGNWTTTLECFPAEDPPPSTSTGSAVQVTNPQDFYAPFKSAMTDALNDTSKLPQGWDTLHAPSDEETPPPVPSDFEPVDTGSDGGAAEVQGLLDETAGNVSGMKDTATGLANDYQSYVDGLAPGDARVTAIPLGSVDFGSGNLADITLDLSEGAPLTESVNWLREALLYVLSVGWLVMSIMAVQDGIK